MTAQAGQGATLMYVDAMSASCSQPLSFRPIVRAGVRTIGRDGLPLRVRQNLSIQKYQSNLTRTAKVNVKQALVMKHQSPEHCQNHPR